ncbi:MAG: HD domain-containing protein [Coriobacteriales bacterium]|jgi:tRNA nucleotidyltransferase (CCA-adding enzyme)|nr:HD domain-containing protein [Coriobacteriales bacterium]
MLAMRIDPGAAYLLERLNEAGHEAYLVGGCVRDLLDNCVPKDWDIATSALPEQVKSCFSDKTVHDTGIRQGTVTVVLDGAPFEVTTFRVEGDYADARRPAQVGFVSSLREDLSRRDFTVNAMAYHPRTGLIDPHGGRRDLRRRELVAVGRADERLKEDALRIMRALRFSSQRELSISPQLGSALHDNRWQLLRIAPERVSAELKGVLSGAGVLDVLLAYPDVLEVFIPEVGPCVGFDQRSVYHDYDVWEHTARAVAAAAPDDLVRLTLLFHDFGKPSCYRFGKDGHGHFPSHGQAGERIARARLTALRFDRKTVDLVATLIRWHSAKLRPDNLMRWLNRIGEEAVRALIEVKRGDIIAHSPVNRADRLAATNEVARALDASLAAGACYALQHLAVTGDDVMALGAVGRQVGAVLDTLLEGVLDGELVNSRPELLAAARGLLGGDGHDKV